MNANVELVVNLVAGVVLGLTVVLVRARRARRRREDLRLGGTVTCAARLAMGGDRLRRGRLELSATEATWRDRRGGQQVALDGARVLSAVGAGGRTAQPEDVVVRLALPWRASARLQLHRDDAATLMEVLEAGGAAPARPGRLAVASAPPRREWWALACLVVAGVWVAGWCWLVAAGESRTVTVTGGDGEGLCEVRWTGTDGRPHTGQVDCADEPAGTPRDVWVLGAPLAGDPIDPGLTTACVLGLGALVAAPGAVRLAATRRRQPALDDPPVPVAHQDLAELSDDDLFPAPGEQPSSVVARLAPYAHRQLPEHGWEHPRRPHGVRGPLTPARVLRSLIGPAAPLTVAATSPHGALGVGGLLLGVLWAGWALHALTRHVRAVHLAHQEPARPGLGLLTAGDDGGPVALVCDPAHTPLTFVAVPLDAPLPHGTAALTTTPGGTAVSVRGDLADGGTVVLEFGGSGTPLMPAGPAVEPDEWTLLCLLDSAGALALEAAADDDWDAYDDGDDDPGTPR